MTRDSLWLWVVIAGAVATFLGAGPPPTQWGWDQWMQAIAMLAGIIAGKLATSPLPGKPKDETVGPNTLRRLPLVCLVALVALGSTAASCPHKRHDTVLTLGVFVTSLHALQQTEMLAYTAGTIPQGTYDPAAGQCTGHRCINARLVEVWDVTDAALVAAQAWRPGAPIPKQIATLIVKCQPILDEALALGAPDLRDRALAVYAAIAGVVGVLGGVS